MDIKNYSNTLFIDRDGVINIEKSNNYILNWNEFKFYEDTFEAFKIFNNFFQNIIVITNQRGVGRNLMSQDDLDNIHKNMKEIIEQNGGRIDKIYFCTDIDKNSINRKPNIGMALQAKKENETIIFDKSIMVGNKLSDMQFGKNIGSKNIFITSTNPENKNNKLVDYYFKNIYEFAKNICLNKY